MKYKLTQKKFQKKWPSDEWLQKAKKKSGRGFGHGKDKWVLVAVNNLKKWISVKYYGHAERLSEETSKEDAIV